MSESGKSTFRAGVLFFILVLGFWGLAFRTAGAAEFSFLWNEPEIRLASPLKIPVPDSFLVPGTLLELHLQVRNRSCGWTLLKPREVYLANGAEKILPESFYAKDSGNCGRIAPEDELTLKFHLPEDFSPTDTKLILGTGITSWETPSGPFSLEVWTGERLRTTAETDSCNRICRGTASGISGVKRAILELPDGEKIEMESKAGADSEGNSDAQPIHFRFRFPLLPEGETEFEAKLTLEKLDGTFRAADLKFRANELPDCAPMRSGEILVGTCFYPAVPDGQADTPEKQAVLRAVTAWDAPKLPNERYCTDFVDEFLADPWGNLAVFWPMTPGPNANSPDTAAEYTEKLADAGIYSMSIYQHASPAKVQELTLAGKNRFFLNANIGEYASFIYQNHDAARACGVPKCENLRECRDFFVEEYIQRGVRRYSSSYPYFFSTSGAALANCELEGGIPFICTELYAIGAQNLAWASSEMRGASRKWKPEYWGGWLAHEWQTGSVPYQSKQKYLLLRAGLYQQYLMGSSLMILESGTQTTQAGRYTAESGKRNFAYGEEPVCRYREEMKRFFNFVKSSPKRTGSPQTRIGVVQGNCDGYVGLNLTGMPVWSQHENAKEDPRWRYGDAQRSSELLQNIFTPLAPKALEPYTNRWLAGSPFGQIDVVVVDEWTRLDDLKRFSLLVYGGWNSMNPKIWNLLTAYVHGGGTLILAVPHLSTRTDCEGKDYLPSDLIHGGNLSGLLNVQITGRTAISDSQGEGEREAENFAQIRLGAGLSEDSGASEGQEMVGNGEVPEGRETVGNGEMPEVLETLAGEPVWIRQRSGKGTVFLFLAWEYPGKVSLADLYAKTIRAEARNHRGEVRLETLPGEESSFSWSVWEEQVFVLNLDCNSEKECVLRWKGKEKKLRIPPAEMLEIHLKEDF